MNQDSLNLAGLLQKTELQIAKPGFWGTCALTPSPIKDMKLVLHPLLKPVEPLQHG